MEVFARDGVTGEICFVEKHNYTANLDGWIGSVLVSPDGAHVYVGVWSSRSATLIMTILTAPGTRS